MRNKKSDLMTSKVNYGYFSSVGGIAGNSLIAATNQRNATERNGFAELI